MNSILPALKTTLKIALKFGETNNNWKIFLKLDKEIQ